MQTPEILADRRRRLLESLPMGSLAVVPPTSEKPSSADATHRYAPSRNLFYLTGIEQENTWLILWRNPEGETGGILFIDAFDPEYEKWFGRRLTKEEASVISGIREVRTDGGFRGAMDRLVARSFMQSIYVDYPVAGLDKLPGTRQRFATELRERWPHLTHSRLSGFIQRLRMKKDELEIATIKRSIELTGTAFEAALATIRPGLREYQVEAEMVRAYIAGGAGEAFPTILAGGPRATCLHYVDNNQVLEDGWLLLMDFGASVELYSSDITRTVPANGRFSQRQRTLMGLVLEAQAEAIRLLRPGIPMAQWNREFNEFYGRRLSEEGIIPDPAALESVYYHRVGHHLGLDTHDEAVLDLPVEAGMVFTVEPGLYLASEGVGIRIEDDVLVGENGNVVLSAGIPREPGDIEAAMRR
jgi:Xaa-Pro aminopeptidase